MMKLLKAFPFIGAKAPKPMAECKTDPDPDLESVALVPTEGEIVKGVLDTLVSEVAQLSAELRPEEESELMAEPEREAPIIGLDEATSRIGKLSISELVRLAEGAGIEMPDSGGVNVEILKSLVLTAYAVSDNQDGRIEFQFPVDSRMGA